MFLGVSYQIDGRLIQIFEAEGMTDQHGQWLRSYGDGPEEEVSPCSCTMDQIDSRITEIVESGQGNKIAQLQLGSHEAVTLFLEGLLTLDHFSRAYEEPGFVVLPEVKLPGGLWMVVSVRISRQKYDLALLDKEGKEITIPVDSNSEESMPVLPDEMVNQAGGELVIAILSSDDGNLDPIDRKEDDAIAAFERRFAKA